MNNVVIVIDGPAGSGKSSIAKKLSQDLPLSQVDSGAMYRTYTWHFLEESLKKNKSIAELLDEQVNNLANKSFEVLFEDKKQQIIFEGVKVEPFIRSPQVTSSIKEIADNITIRKLVNKQIRRIAESYDIVADGRDMGTVVFPDADIKFFLDASLSERAGRRFIEFQTKNPNISVSEVATQIEKRDKEDQAREYGALKRAEDAILIDTTSQNLDEVFKIMKEYLKSNQSEKIKKILI